MIIQRLKYSFLKAIQTYRYKRDISRSKTNLNRYSFAAFHYYQCIFVHIPRTAGVAINRALFGSLGGGHKMVHYYKQIFGRDFDRYYKFTFVRNPWDRLWSSYIFLKNKGFDKEDKKWSDQYLEKIESFEDFVINYLDSLSVMTKNHFIPQFRFVCDKNHNLQVDFCGKYENLHQDFLYVSEKLGIHGDIELMNSSKAIDYRNVYSDAMIDIVADKYKVDIQLFGYTFDGNQSKQYQVIQGPS